MTPPTHTLIKLLVGRYLYRTERKGENYEGRKLEKGGWKGGQRQRNGHGRKRRKEAEIKALLCRVRNSFSCTLLRRGESKVFAGSSAPSLHLHFRPFLSPSLLLRGSLWWCSPPAITWDRWGLEEERRPREENESLLAHQEPSPPLGAPCVPVRWRVCMYAMSTWM